MTPCSGNLEECYFTPLSLVYSSRSDQACRSQRFCVAVTVISERWYTGWDHTLQTTQNRHSLRVLFRVGVQCESTIYGNHRIMATISQGMITRCVTNKMNLDGEKKFLRTDEHAEFLVRKFELGKLWTDYGIVGDVVVGSSPGY